MDLASLGWDAALEEAFAAFRQRGWTPARVVGEDKHYFTVVGEAGELTGQASGRLLHEAASTAALPKVGDWVAIAIVSNEDKAVIHAVLPRRTRLVRKTVGREVEEQVLVANINTVFVVQSLDASFNLRRLERFLVMANEGGAGSVVVLNKTDLCDDWEAKLVEAQVVAGVVPVIAASAKTGRGIKRLREFIRPSESVVFVGSSGVGKSSLINRLYGEEIQATIEVRESDAKGRHTTTWREMILLPNGGLVIDTPGLREFHLWTADEGLEGAFPEIEELATRCHFRECSHTAEKRCAVLEALAQGDVSRERYESYLKLKRELARLVGEKSQHVYRERKRQTRIAQRAFSKLKRAQWEE